MPDVRPERTAAGERETLHVLLQYQRDSIVRKVTGVSAADAQRRFVGSGTTLQWLLRHLAYAERLWVVSRFAGLPMKMPPEEGSADDTWESAIADYRAMWAEVDAVADAASLDDVCTNVEGPPTNLRWVLTHLLDETSRHAGHADIIRELIDGEVGR